MKRKIVILIIFVGLTSGLVSISIIKKNPHNRTVRASYGEINDIIVAQGRIEALKKVDLSSEVGGTIKEIFVEEGDIVEKGRVLLRFNDAHAKATLDQAKANLHEVDLRLARTRNLYKKAVVPKADLDRVEAEAKIAEAKLTFAKASLNDKIIKASISGKIIHKYFEPGETVSPSVVIFTIADLNKIYAKVEVDEIDIGKLRLGQLAEITCEGYPNKVFKGKVSEIGFELGKRQVKLSDPARITDMKVLETNIELNPDIDLKLGSIVDAEIVIAAKENVLIIPKQAIRTGPDGNFVTILDETGNEVTRKVRLGYYDDWDIEILEGLSEGNQIVLSPPSK